LSRLLGTEIDDFHARRTLHRSRKVRKRRGRKVYIDQPSTRGTLTLFR
jgi:hypothetical protein